MATAYYTPGVYIEEEDKGSKPIEGVATSVAAFIGFTEKAEKYESDRFTRTSLLGKPTQVTNWGQYEEFFGSFVEDAYLPHAVRGFFDNGGSRCYIISVRVSKRQNAQAIINGKKGRNGKEIPALLIEAKEGGLNGNSLQIMLKESSIGDDGDIDTVAKRFTLEVTKNGTDVTRVKNTRQQQRAESFAIDEMREERLEKEKEWAKIKIEDLEEQRDRKRGDLTQRTNRLKTTQSEYDDLKEKAEKLGIDMSAEGDAWEEEKKKWKEKSPSADEMREKLLTLLPQAIDDLKKNIANLEREIADLDRDIKAGSTAALKRQKEQEWVAAWIAKAEGWPLTMSDIPAWSDRERSEAKRLVEGQSEHVRVWRLDNSTNTSEIVPEVGEHALANGLPSFDFQFLEETKLLSVADGKSMSTSPGKESEIFLSKLPELHRGSESRRKGIDGLYAIDDVTIVCAPDLMQAYNFTDKETADNLVKSVQGAILAFCQKAHYPFAVLDTPPGLGVQEVSTWRMQSGGDTMHGALYYPWIKIADPLNAKRQIEVPPCGHIAGIYARSDTQRGVHKAPANEPVNGAVDLPIKVTHGEQELLNPIGVNCIRQFPGRGIRVWGARTLSMTDPAWRYINVRRLFSYVEASVEQSTQWVVFEPNDYALWSKVTRDVTAFLRTVWLSGALFGRTPEEAFYVKCDESTNLPELRDLGQMVCEIGLAPVKPAEFVIFRFSQWTAEADTGG